MDNDTEASLNGLVVISLIKCRRSYCFISNGTLPGDGGDGRTDGRGSCWAALQWSLWGHKCDHSHVIGGRVRKGDSWVGKDPVKCFTLALGSLEQTEHTHSTFTLQLSPSPSFHPSHSLSHTPSPLFSRFRSAVDPKPSMAVQKTDSPLSPSLPLREFRCF